jgi:hypothetical protein
LALIFFFFIDIFTFTFYRDGCKVNYLFFVKKFHVLSNHKQGQKWEKQNKEAFYSVSSLLREEEKRCGSRAHLVSLSYFCPVPNRRNSVFLFLLSRSSFSLLHFSQNKQTLSVSFGNGMLIEEELFMS